MELSCKSEYALLALLELVRGYSKGETVQMKQIVSNQNLPHRYLEHLFGVLKRHGIVKSQRGVNGGYSLARPPHEITFLEVIRCLDGNSQSNKPADSEDRSLECVVIGEIWDEAQQAAEAVLNRYTLQDLTEKWFARQANSLMYYI